MKKNIMRFLALCLILALCLCAGSAAFADGKPGVAQKIAKKASGSDDASETVPVLEEVRSLIEAGKMYDAALACDEGYDDYPEYEDDFLALWEEIADTCEKNMPKTQELERTFQFQGGNDLTIDAESGNAEVTIRDLSSKGKPYSRVFVRSGDSITVNLPSGEYEISYKVGDIWFNDKVGFGDFCEEYDLDETLDIPYTSSGGWVTYYSYTLSV